MKYLKGVIGYLPNISSYWSLENCSICTYVDNCTNNCWINNLVCHFIENKRLDLMHLMRLFQILYGINYHVLPKVHHHGWKRITKTHHAYIIFLSRVTHVTFFSFWTNPCLATLVEKEQLPLMHPCPIIREKIIVTP